MKTFKELQTKLAEDQYSAEYIIKHYVDPVTGENKTRKVRPHRVTFANSKMGGEPVQQDDMKEGYVSANSAPDIQPQMNEGKMGQIHADIEDHLGKHLSNYKKMGGSEHFGNKTVEAAKKISKAHGIAQHHAQKLVNDYVDSALKESDESWAAAMEKQKKDRLTDKDKGTLGKVADMMAKEKAKREFDLKMKKAQNSQRVAKALGEEVELDEAAAAGLAAKAKKSGVPLSTLKTVYKRGVAAWNSGHRPGTTPQQWGMARVNSYITKGKGTYHGADKDLREEEIQEDSRLNKSGYHKGLSVATAKARVAHWKKMDKLSDRDPRAYEPAPGDKTAKTKPSVHTKKYHAMYGEEKKEDLPFTPDKPKKNPAAKAGKYGQGYSTARHLARQAMKKMAKEDVNLTEAHVVHVSDGSKYDEEPHKDDVKHVNDGVKKHGGTFDGHSDKGAFFKFKSHSDAENFRRHVNACPKRSCSADHLDESVNEAVDKEHPIYKEYQALRKMPIKDLRDRIKQQHRIVDTSEFRTKEHAASHIINTKHGNKRVKAVFGEETEQIDELSKKTLKSYGTKASMSNFKKSLDMKTAQQKWDKSIIKKHLTKRPEFTDAEKKKMDRRADYSLDALYKGYSSKNEEVELDEAYRLPSDSEISKVKAHVKANHPNKSLAQVAVHKQSKKIEYVVKDKDGKMTGHTLGEEVEQIDEISKQTLGNYIKRSSHDAALSARHGGSDPKELKNAIKRLKGIAKATNKLTKEETEQIEEASKINWPKEVPSDRDALRAHNRDDEDRDPHPYVNPYDQGARKHSEPKKNVKEDVEQIDELSKDTLNSYVHKAFAQGNDLHYDLAHSRGNKATDAERAAMKAKLSKRNTGIIKAAKKLREDDKVYDERWKKYVGKSFKKATE